jgi:hypothetical protein
MGTYLWVGLRPRHNQAGSEPGLAELCCLAGEAPVGDGRPWQKSPKACPQALEHRPPVVILGWELG